MYGATVILSNDIVVELIIDDLVAPYIKHAMLYMVGETFKDSDKVDENSKHQLAKLANEEAPGWAEIALQKQKADWNDLVALEEQERLENGGKLKEGWAGKKLQMAGKLASASFKLTDKFARQKMNAQIKNSCTENICSLAIELRKECDEAWELVGTFGNKDKYCNDWNEAMNQCAKTETGKNNTVIEYGSWKLRKLKSKSDDLHPQQSVEVQIKEEKRKIKQEAQKKLFNEKLSDAYGCKIENTEKNCKLNGVQWTKMMDIDTDADDNEPVTTTKKPITTKNGCGAFYRSPCNCKFNRLNENTTNIKINC